MRRPIALLSCFLLVPAVSFAGSRAKEIHISLSSYLYRGVFDARYDNDYAPVHYSALPGTRAWQTLSLEGGGGTGLALSIVYYFNKRMGIRISAGRSRFDIEGANSPYNVFLKYTSTQPPDYKPRVATYERTLSWGRTEGQIKTTFATLGLEMRRELSRVFQAAISAAAGVYQVSGEFSPLGYSRYTIGGHGVLFPWNDIVYLKIPESVVPGLNLGAELTASLGGGMFIWLRGAYDLVGRVSEVPVIERAVDYDFGTPVAGEDLASISKVLALKKLRFSPSAVCLGAGLGFGF